MKWVPEVSVVIRDDFRMRFSERHGYRAVRTAIQIEELDEVTRRQVWNVLFEVAFMAHGPDAANAQQAVRRVWAGVYHEHLDEFPYMAQAEDWLKRNIMGEDWYRAYDIIEELCTCLPTFRRAINMILAHNKCGYRLIESRIIPISDPAELAAIEEAIGTAHEGARHHLRQALEHLADRDNPDYVAVIRDSINAVESKVTGMTTKDTLGKALDELKRQGPYTHGSLIDGWKKIYGWASDEDGLRHGGEKAPVPDQNLARYMLVTSSAFINLMTALEAN